LEVTFRHKSTPKVLQALATHASTTPQKLLQISIIQAFLGRKEFKFLQLAAQAPADAQLVPVLLPAGMVRKLD
jgi:hypothetical protein